MKNTTNTPASKPLSSAGLDLARGDRPSPSLLNYACAINGFATRSPNERFTYCEIGAAEGNDLLFLAAANPQGHFLGIQTDSAAYDRPEAKAASESSSLRQSRGFRGHRFYQS